MKQTDLLNISSSLECIQKLNVIFGADEMNNATLNIDFATVANFEKTACLEIDRILKVID